MRKLVILAISLVALAAVVAPLASATVAVDNGVGHVDKGDVQSALKWNNGDFDKGVGSLKFTASAEKVAADYQMSCYDVTNGTGVIPGAVGHRLIIWTGTTKLTPTQVLSSNGKQITGWNLTAPSTGFTYEGGYSRDTGCPEGSVLFMNLGQGDQVNKITISGGLKVNDVALPNTPVPTV